MSIRYQKRVELGQGLGLNLSKSGVSPSLRTSFGSIGSRGFSIRTGIPGLYWRNSFGGKAGKNGGVIILLFIMFVGAAVLAVIVALNIIRFLYWVLIRVIIAIGDWRRSRKLRNDTVLACTESDVHLVKFTKELLPTRLHGQQVSLVDHLVLENEFVDPKEPLMRVLAGAESGTLFAISAGRVRFYKRPGEVINEGDSLYVIDEKMFRYGHS